MAWPKSVVTAKAFHHQERCKDLAQRQVRPCLFLSTVTATGLKLLHRPPPGKGKVSVGEQWGEMRETSEVFCARPGSDTDLYQTGQRATVKRLNQSVGHLGACA